MSGQDLSLFGEPWTLQFLAEYSRYLSPEIMHGVAPVAPEFHLRTSVKVLGLTRRFLSYKFLILFFRCSVLTPCCVVQAYSRDYTYMNCPLGF